jgi:hypothetical protein
MVRRDRNEVLGRIQREFESVQSIWQVKVRGYQGFRL